MLTGNLMAVDNLSVDEAGDGFWLESFELAMGDGAAEVDTDRVGFGEEAAPGQGFEGPGDGGGDEGNSGSPERRDSGLEGGDLAIEAASTFGKDEDELTALEAFEGFLEPSEAGTFALDRERANGADEGTYQGHE